MMCFGVGCLCMVFVVFELGFLCWFGGGGCVVFVGVVICVFGVICWILVGVVVFCFVGCCWFGGVVVVG